MTKQTLDVVLSETTKLLEAERAQCAKLSTKLEREQEQLRKSRSDWAPVYKKWYSVEIAPVADRARELHRQASDQRAFMRRVESAAQYLYCRPRDAAALVEKALRGEVIFEELEHEFYETGLFPRGPLQADVDAYLRLRFARERFPKLKPAEFEEDFEGYKRELLEEHFGHELEPTPSPFEEARL
jgi:hypothetical protein